MELRLITPATADILTLAEAKAHLRIYHNDEDGYISDLCDAVRDHLTGEAAWLGVSVLPQTWELTAERFPGAGCIGNWPGEWAPRNDKRPVDALVLPRPPLVSVTGLYYTPADSGAESTITNFRTIGATTQGGSYILPAKNESWPSTDGEPGSVRVRYTAGYASLPGAIRHAAKLLVAHWFLNREATSDTKMVDLPLSIVSLLSPYRHFI